MRYRAEAIVIKYMAMRKRRLAMFYDVMLENKETGRTGHILTFTDNFDHALEVAARLNWVMGRRDNRVVVQDGHTKVKKKQKGPFQNPPARVLYLANVPAAVSLQSEDQG